MSKLVDIMKDMNEQITKLADAVSEAVHSADEHNTTSSSEDEDRASASDNNIQQQSKQECACINHEHIQNMNHNDIEEKEEEEQSKQDTTVETVIEIDDTISELSNAHCSDDNKSSDSELTLNMNRAPNPRSYLRKDLREYLLSKVLSVDE